MAKLRGPLLSFQASQQLAQELSYQHRPGLDRVTRKPTPTQPRTLPQVYHRQDYSDYVLWWNQLSAAQKASYEAQAAGQNYTPYNAWMRTQLISLSDLAARYHLDIMPGNVTPDSGPNGLDGTVFGAVITPGLWGQALLFEGLDDWVSLGTPSQFSELPEMTIETWFRTTIVGFQAYVAKQAMAAFEWRIYQTPIPALYFRVDQANGVIYAIAGTAAPTFTDGNWHHVVGVLRDTVDIVLWIDGQEYNRNSNFAGVRGPDNGAPCVIGRAGAIPGAYFTGTFEEFRIYNRALSTLDILQHYERGAALL